MFELGGFEAMEFEGVGDLGSVYAVLGLVGEAVVEFVSTTTFSALIEDGTASFGFAAEIHLRSL